jgi:hypothetical protein
MAASVVEQQPLHSILPVGQEVIFVVSNADAVANQIKVKFIAEVHIAKTNPLLTSSTDVVGTFKTTPNDAGVGIFDFSNIVETYLKAQNIGYYSAATSSKYKTATNTGITRHPLHLIDQFSLNNDCVRHLGINFSVEYEDASGVVVADTGTNVTSSSFILFNGYLKYTDVLDLSTSTTGTYAGEFGYNLEKFGLNGVGQSFLSNAPTVQYANRGDYGTIAILNWNELTPYLTSHIELKYYNAAGTLLTSENVYNTSTQGGSVTATNSDERIIFFGCYPGNLENWSTKFNTYIGSVDDIAYYTIQAYNAAGAKISSLYTIHIKCKDLKNYEPIRLCWLNQWGTWDYYTFTKKSSRTFNSSGTTYTQLEGSWNGAKYRVDSHRGGKKTFRVNSIEKIKINTDFVTEDENVMFEELTNSPEVYLLQGFQSDVNNPMLNQYVTPVRLISKSFTKKTAANDNLIQYSFEIEKTKTLRTQSV